MMKGEFEWYNEIGAVFEDGTTKRRFAMGDFIEVEKEGCASIEKRQSCMVGCGCGPRKNLGDSMVCAGSTCAGHSLHVNSLNAAACIRVLESELHRQRSIEGRPGQMYLEHVVGSVLGAQYTLGLAASTG